MALTLLAANNAQTVLAAGISASATSLTVNSGTGSLFPAPSAGVSFFKLTLIDAATGQLTEIMHVTARTGDTMTIERGQEGTTARAWSANDIAANMMTAETLSYLLSNFQPLDATLTALAGLTTGANKLPYFTGTDTASQTDLTSVGRDIIGKGTIADILTYLGLGKAAKLPSPTFTTGTGYTLFKSPYYDGATVRWFATLSMNVTPPALTNNQTFAVTFPVAFSSDVKAVLSSAIGELTTTAVTQDLGCGIQSLSTTGMVILSAWGARAVLDGDFQFIVTGIMND
ncbi:hypothetical protein [Enterobacter kobei]|uniref:hypothetical protein n=1 Tax=Enterobacter kobei TaxID=208224 RepID=UPI002147E44F|nr:hypothetical protein [Enterobacter kobei]MCR1298370.1 hypothetical protein [Enterobacter kobei]